MREVKFRIWDGIKLIYQDDINYIDFRSGFASVFDKYNYVDNCSKGIDIDNIMQYTGLKNIEGKEIYEGDIVEFYSNVEDEIITEKVEYHFGIYRAGDYFVGKIYNKCKVIGNIYENPELLV